MTGLYPPPATPHEVLTSTSLCPDGETTTNTPMPSYGPFGVAQLEIRAVVSESLGAESHCKLYELNVYECEV